MSLQGEEYEITTLRKDIDSSGRGATVEFIDDWREDALRRDFTINSLSLDSAGRLYDYASGEDDIKNKKVRFIGDPKVRILEDYLRILRFFRFVAKLGINSIDEKSLEACVSEKTFLNKLSGERITEEMSKLLVEKHANQVIEVMYRYGILEEIDFCIITGVNFNINFSRDYMINIVFLLRDINALNKMLNRWRFSKRVTNCLKFLCNNLSLINDSMGLSEHKKLLYKFKEDYLRLLEIYTLIKGEKNKENRNLIGILKKCKFPKYLLNGEDIKKNFPDIVGSGIGKLLKRAEEEWLESNCTLPKAQLINLLKKSIK